MRIIRPDFSGNNKPLGESYPATATMAVTDWRVRYKNVFGSYLQSVAAQKRQLTDYLIGLCLERRGIKRIKTFRRQL